MSQDFIPAAKPIIGDEERAAVDAVMASGMLAQGKQVADFETEFSQVLLDGRASVASTKYTHRKTLLVLGEPARHVRGAHGERPTRQTEHQADGQKMPVSGGISHQPNRGNCGRQQGG